MRYSKYANLNVVIVKLFQFFGIFYGSAINVQSTNTLRHKRENVLIKKYHKVVQCKKCLKLVSVVVR